jgi:hypothetical protein
MLPGDWLRIAGDVAAHHYTYDDFVNAGVVLVRLQDVGGSGILGFATIEQASAQPVEDAISTRVRILLLTGEGSTAPPAGTPSASPVALSLA